MRITHIPTGVVVSCQDERSQLKNRNKAMRTLRARIVEAERERQEAEIAQNRKAQVGTGERSEDSYLQLPAESGDGSSRWGDVA